ncbi:MAG TPA: phosphate acyltransferase [Planctomycetaceae bacterium]|nr:phosphate acyltransferase [Planctomycetaceae bacterium]
MPLTSFDDLARVADVQRPQVSVVAAGAADETVLQALSEAQSRGWVKAILAGDESEIRKSAGLARIDLAPMEIVDSIEAVATAVAQVRGGRAEMLMKGQVDTPTLLRAILDPVKGLRTGETISQVALMEIRDQGRRFLMADVGITIEPTLAQKAEIVSGVIQVARQLGSTEPRVALLSATEKPNSGMPDTLESAELQRRNAGGEFPGAVIQGPLSFDLAYAVGAGAKKPVAGGVIGAADALVFPNLVAANLTIKGIMYTADCRFGGILHGAACPVAFMSRADTTATRLHSLLLALRTAERISYG